MSASEPPAVSPRSGAAPSAVVVGLDNITGLQTARLLHRRGVRVVGIARDGRHPACRTNACNRLVVGDTDGAGLVATLDRLRRVEDGAVLFPCTDGAVHTLAHHRDDLGGFRVVLPAADVVDKLMDKRRFAELMAANDLPAPRSAIVLDRAGAQRAADELRFPCVVKPSLRTSRWEAAGPKVRQLEDASSWLAIADDLLDLHPELVVQEWLPGGDEQLYSCNVYVASGGIPIVTFVARKLRQWPPHAGVSSLGEAVLDEGIRELALDVISTVDFCGLGYVEIKRSPLTGEDHVIEVNVGRPTGRSAIAEAGGVELLYSMYRDAIGQPLPVDRRQHDRPVKWMHVGRDVRSAWYYLRHGELTLDGWRRSLRGRKVYADLDVADPVPFVAELTRGLRRRAGATVTRPAVTRTDDRQAKVAA